jgi:hypothetical protein
MVTVSISSLSPQLLGWADLMRGAPRGLIHIEYDFTASGALDHLQVWSSIARGGWLLACGYQRAASEFFDTGVHFTMDTNRKIWRAF